MDSDDEFDNLDELDQISDRDRYNPEPLIETLGDYWRELATSLALLALVVLIVVMMLGPIIQSILHH